jgi:transketolase
MTDRKLDDLCVNTIRTLAMDAVQKANSGHAGAPMGGGLMTYVLWDRYLKHNPADQHWPDRDRFVLSAGHASMLLYSLLHLTGYDVSMDDLKNFRQWLSPTAGHPEHGLAPGIETTTGPLGQGFGNGVGMALAERFLAATYNRAGHEIIDHYTYAFVSDGDLMEGISHEAASFAGHQRLGKLVYLYDANKVTIDGSTDLTYTEDVAKRFEAYGWHIQRIDGMDYGQVDAAIRTARDERERPSLIIAHTVIGYGAPTKQGTAKAHSDPLGEDEIRAAKRNYGWPEDAQFLVPDEALAHFRKAVERGSAWQLDWETRLRAYGNEYPREAEQLRGAFAREVPDGWEDSLPSFTPDDKAVATRAASGQVLNAIADALPTLIGGSADLTGSNNTELKGKGTMSADEPAGRNIHFGVREHAMGAALNGMAAHGGVIPYGGTFMVFSDYQRPSIRLAALSEFRSIFVLTHDSVGLGEDGPTHQPIEHLMALRVIPELMVVRPADGNEVAMAWKVALEHHGPTALALTRQAVPHLAETAGGGARGLLRGAYVIREAEGGRPDAIIIATGSEVSTSLAAQEQLAGQGVRARVVSMPCWELFEQQDEAYRDEVLPPDVPGRISVEAGVTLGWKRWVGERGDSIGIDNRFGASAPGTTVLKNLGFNPDNIAQRTLALVEHLSGVRT